MYAHPSSQVLSALLTAFCLFTSSYVLSSLTTGARVSQTITALLWTVAVASSLVAMLSLAVVDWIAAAHFVAIAALASGTVQSDIIRFVL